MKASNKVKGTAVPMPAGVAMGTLTSIVFTGISAVLLTWMILSGKVDETSIGYFSMGIILIGSLIGALLSAGKIKRRRMLVCGITGGAYYFTLILCTLIFFGGNFRGLGVTAIMVLVGSLASGLLGLRKQNRHRRVSKKYRTC